MTDSIKHTPRWLAANPRWRSSGFVGPIDTWARPPTRDCCLPSPNDDEAIWKPVSLTSRPPPGRSRDLTSLLCGNRRFAQCPGELDNPSQYIDQLLASDPNDQQDVYESFVNAGI